MNLLVKGKGERVSEGEGFYSCPAIPERRSAVNTGLKKNQHIYKHVGNRKPRMENTTVDTVKLVKMINTHKDTATETHLLFIHTFFFLHPAAFFSFLQTVWPLHSPITTSNHKCNSQGHVQKDNGQSKIKLVICSYLCCNWEKWYK